MSMDELGILEAVFFSNMNLQSVYRKWSTENTMAITMVQAYRLEEPELIYPENWEQHQIEMAIFRQEMRRQNLKSKRNFYPYNDKI